MQTSHSHVNSAYLVYAAPSAECHLLPRHRRAGTDRKRHPWTCRARSPPAGSEVRRHFHTRAAAGDAAIFAQDAACAPPQEPGSAPLLMSARGGRRRCQRRAVRAAPAARRRAPAAASLPAPPAPAAALVAAGCRIRTGKGSQALDWRRAENAMRSTLQLTGAAHPAPSCGSGVRAKRHGARHTGVRMQECSCPDRPPFGKRTAVAKKAIPQK